MNRHRLAAGHTTRPAGSLETGEPESVPTTPLRKGGDHPHIYRIALWVIVLLGIALRVAQYLYDRSLWLDEAFLSLNVLDRPFGELLGQLSFNQAAPVGFLLIERADVELFGKSEYALRLFPLACGIASVFLFRRVASVILNRYAVLVALILFSASELLVYYSSEVKQYSTDVAAALVLMVAGLELQSRSLSRRRLLLWVPVGPIAVLFSHSSALVVGAVFVVLVAHDIMTRRWKHLERIAVVLGAWIISLTFALVYTRSTISHLLRSYDESNDAVFPNGLTFFRNAAGGLIDALGIPASGWAHASRYPIGVIALIGAVSLARRAPFQFALVAMPTAFVVAAAALRVYPVLTRTILFLLPFVIVVISEGVFVIASRVRKRRALAALGFAVAVCTLPTARAVEHFFHPRQREEMKPVLRHLVDEWQAGDSLYVFYRAQYALRYYLECDCLLASNARERLSREFTFPERAGPAQFAPALLARSQSVLVAQPQRRLSSYLEGMTRFQGKKRVWVLVTAADRVERSLLAYLSCVGRRREAFVQDEGSGLFGFAAVYKYDLSAWRSLTEPCAPASALRHRTVHEIGATRSVTCCSIKSTGRRSQAARVARHDRRAGIAGSPLLGLLRWPEIA
jgi:hypothetical protein